MKKVSKFPLLLALASLGLASCGGDDTSSTPPPAESSTGTSDIAETSESDTEDSSSTPDITSSDPEESSSDSSSSTADPVTSTGSDSTDEPPETSSEEPVVVSQVTITPDTLALGYGETAALTAEIEPAEAETEITWESSDPETVSVDEEGNIIAVEVGDATITATADNGVYGTAAISVTDENEYLSIVEGELTGLFIGDSFPLNIGGIKSTGYGRYLSTSDETVIAVDGDTLTAVAEGKATITINAGENTVSADIYVYDPDVFSLVLQEDGTYWYVDETIEEDDGEGGTAETTIEYTGTYETIVFPTSYEGVPITGIGYQAFYQDTNLVNIVIPKEIETIGEDAFRGSISYDSQLTSLVFNSNSRLTTFGENAFFYCGNLTGALYVPDGVETLPQNCFRNTRVSSVIFGEDTKIKTIESFVFSILSSWEAVLDKVYFPADAPLESIGASAFVYQTALSDITLPTSGTLKSIGQYAFRGASFTSIDLPEGLETLDNYVFHSCASLLSIDIPSTVTTLGNNVFQGCTALTSITIPATVTSIGTGLFYSCENLKEINISDETLAGTIPENTFRGSGIESWTVSSSITSIGASAFRGCENLTEVTFAPDSQVETIGNYAFANCAALETITIPKSVTSLGNYVFQNCTKLKEIVFEDGSLLTSIGNYAFEGCEALERIVIPGGVSSVGTYLFRYCSALTEVTFEEGVSITTIGNYAFYECTKLESVELPSTLTSIGNYAFRYCESLLEIRIPDGVTSITTSAFRDCTSLTAAYIPASVTTLGTNVFTGCDPNKLTIYAYAESQPSGWSSSWNSSGCPVVWSYTDTGVDLTGTYVGTATATYDDTHIGAGTVDIVVTDAANGVLTIYIATLSSSEQTAAFTYYCHDDGTIDVTVEGTELTMQYDETEKTISGSYPYNSFIDVEIEATLVETGEGGLEG